MNARAYMTPARAAEPGLESKRPREQEDMNNVSRSTYLVHPQKRRTALLIAWALVGMGLFGWAVLWAVVLAGRLP